LHSNILPESFKTSMTNKLKPCTNFGSTIMLLWGRPSGRVRARRTVLGLRGDRPNINGLAASRNVCYPTRFTRSLPT
jgi:hypothetical protein